MVDKGAFAASGLHLQMVFSVLYVLQGPWVQYATAYKRDCYYARRQGITIANRAIRIVGSIAVSLQLGRGSFNELAAAHWQGSPRLRRRRDVR